MTNGIPKENRYALRRAVQRLVPDDADREEVYPIIFWTSELRCMVKRDFNAPFGNRTHTRYIRQCDTYKFRCRLFNHLPQNIRKKVPTKIAREYSKPKP